MTQEEIKEMAKKVYGDTNWTEASLSRLETLIKLAIAAEREACAKVCESGVDTEHPTVKGHIMKDFGASPHLANAIRARGQA